MPDTLPDAAPAPNAVRPPLADLAERLSATTSAFWSASRITPGRLVTVRPDGALVNVWQPGGDRACWTLEWDLLGPCRRIAVEICGHADDLAGVSLAGLSQLRDTIDCAGLTWHHSRAWHQTSPCWTACGPGGARLTVSQDGHGDRWGWRCEDVGEDVALLFDPLACHTFVDFENGPDYQGCADSFDAACAAAIRAPDAFRAALLAFARAQATTESGAPDDDAVPTRELLDGLRALQQSPGLRAICAARAVHPNFPEGTPWESALDTVSRAAMAASMVKDARLAVDAAALAAAALDGALEAEGGR